MLLSVMRTHCWELWLRHRTGLLLLLAGYALFLLLFLIFGHRIEALGHTRMIYLPVMGSLLYLQMIFSYDDIENMGQDPGFPHFRFTLPLSTQLLITPPMLSAFLVMPCVWLAWALPFTWLFQEPAPLWTPMVMVAVGSICLQTVSWTLGRNVILGVLAAATVVGSLGFLGLHMSLALEANDGSRLLLVLAAFTAIAAVTWFIALHVIGLQRRGDQWLPRLRWRATDAAAKRRSPFTDPAKAHLWYEWRRGVRWFAPLVAMVFVMFYLLPLFATVEREGFWIMMLVFNLIIPLVSNSVGLEMAKNKPGCKDPILSAFDGVLPRSDTQLANARLQAAAYGLLLTWVVRVLLTIGWVLISNHGASFSQVLSSLAEQRGTLFLVALVVMMIWLELGLSWACLGLSLSLGLLGSKRVQGTVVVLAILANTGLMFTGIAVNQNMSLLDQLQTYLPYVSLILLLPFAIGTATALKAAHGKGLISPGALWRHGLITTLAAGTGLIIALALTTNNVILAGVALSLTTLVVMGQAAVASAPLALHYNRHR